MLQERRRKIIDLIKEKKVIKVNELMEMFNISIETVRRDLESLEKEGYLNRVYGGAVLRTSYGTEPDFYKREVEHLNEKKAIAQAALEFIQNGDTLFLDVGTTILELAKCIKENRSVTVLTNSLKVSMLLSESPGITVIMLGGVVRPNEFSTSGFLAEENLQRFNADKAFIGVGGITPDGWITDFNINEANLRRQMIANAQNVIALADSSKFGVKAMNKICKCEDINILITDTSASQKDIEFFEKTGLKVIQCKSE
ncbi:MAG TPA: DeoR/GlpR transcriptional regulator [Clostridiaceae bacterium]|nr:DeoR/GlpR transcriptional regulator [Clostridiaceae bacterium]